MEAHLYIDIIIFAVIAGVLAANLYRILGKKTDTPDLLAKKGQTEFFSEESLSLDPLLDASELKLQKLDKNFNTSNFLEGAKSAFNLIVSSYKQNKLEGVKGYLSKNVYSIFEKAISSNEQEEHEESTFEIIKLNASIIKIDIVKKLARIKVEFLSLQKTKKNDNHEEQEIKDVWTFEKEVSNPDPNWLLIEVSSE